VSTGADIAAIAAPALTALGGGYLGARWQARSKADEEVRRVLEEATEELEHLAEATARTRSRFFTEGARATSEDGIKALGDLEVQVAKNRVLRDRILIRVRPDSPVYVHYVNVLQANGRESKEFRAAALTPNDQAEYFNQAEAWSKIEAAEADFERERSAYLMAANAIMGRRPGVLRRVLDRAKRSDTHGAEPSGTRPNSEQG
jgi:hypothetical protein